MLKLGAREQIEQLQPYTRVKRNQRFILRVDTRDMRRQLFEQGNRCWLIVYEDPALGGYFATENQACVVGVNRIGNDPYYAYGGHSLIIDPLGEILADAGTREGLIQAKLDLANLRKYRESLPFLADMRSR